MVMNMKNDIDRFIGLTKKTEFNEEYADLVLQRFHSEKQVRMRRQVRRTNLVSGLTSLTAVLIIIFTLSGIDRPVSTEYSYSGQSGLFYEYPEAYTSNGLTGTDTEIEDLFKEEIANHILPGDNSEELLQVMRDYQIEASEVVKDLSEDETEFLLNNL